MELRRSGQSAYLPALRLSGARFETVITRGSAGRSHRGQRGCAGSMSYRNRCRLLVVSLLPVTMKGRCTIKGAIAFTGESPMRQAPRIGGPRPRRMARHKDCDAIVMAHREPGMTIPRLISATVTHQGSSADCWPRPVAFSPRLTADSHLGRSAAVEEGDEPADHQRNISYQARPGYKCAMRRLWPRSLLL